MTNPISLSYTSFQGPDTFLLDSATRIKYNSSVWYSIFNRKEKQQLNEHMWQAVCTYFQKQYDIPDPQIFKRVWKEIGSNIWSIKSPLTVGALRAIDIAFQKQLVYHGSGITAPLELNPNPNPTVQKVVNALLHGGPLSTSLIQKPLLQAIFVKKDAAWLKEFRLELQRELDQLAENPPRDEKEKILWKGFLGNIISLLPFSYPDENEIITFPCLNDNGSCHRVEYRVNVLELTPTSVSTPISAIGLTPKAGASAPPILSFLGTTFPGGDGFAATVLADFTPGMSVGEAVYKQGKNKIDMWLKDKKDVYLVGTSLGGALAFHTLLDHQTKLSRVDVYNPPGLYEKCWKNHKFDEGCDINIYCQAGDLVSKMGSWPTGSKVGLYRVFAHQNGVSEGIATSHARVFTGCKKVTILKKDPLLENQRFSRKALTFLHRILGPWLIYYPTSLLLGIYRISNAVQRCWADLWKKPKTCTYPIKTD